MSKRGREEVTLEDGVSAAKAIISLATANLAREDRVSNLPYPGIGVPPGRPPVRLVYVGSDFIFDLAEFFWNPKKPRLLIEGPRGVGKSSDLRALACFLHSHFALNKTKDVLVSIWNLHAAVVDQVQVVKDALLFAYLVKWEGQLIVGPLEPAEGYEEEDDVDFQSDADEDVDSQSDADEQKMEEEDKLQKKQQEEEGAAAEKERIRLLEAAQAAVENERKAVTEQIQKITGIEEAIEFVEGRKREQGEVFHFFGDGWEVFDADKTDRPRVREKVQNLLEGFFSHGSTSILALSGDSTILEVTRTDTHIMTKVNSFSEEQYESYKKLSILGQLDRVRSKDIDFCTGRVPWLLEILLECCDAFGRQTVADKRRAYKRVHIGGRLDQVAVFSAGLPELYPKGDKLAEMLSEDDAWAAVLSMFREKLKGSSED